MGGFLSEVEIVCLLLQYDKAVSGEDYWSLLGAAVQCPVDIDAERVKDLVRRYALNLQTWCPSSLGPLYATGRCDALSQSSCASSRDPADGLEELESWMFALD